MLSVYMAVRSAPVPQIAAARAERVRPLDPDIARVEREGVAAFDAAPLKALREELLHPSSRSSLCANRSRWRRIGRRKEEDNHAGH